MSKKVLVITMETDNDQILDTIELTDCDAVCITPEGYQCLPPQDPTEPQQYPTGNTEEFVQYITGGGLRDIPINDSRWGNREEGEIFGRENDDFITWFWPKGGKGLFDPTRLGNVASWYDYRTASDRAGGGPHTSIPLSAGMNIQFSDDGGGVSIFQRKG